MATDAASGWILEFQYILCCGSTLWYNIKGGDCFGISIHLMLWFNNWEYDGTVFDVEFQYILCCGSTLSKLIIKPKHNIISIHLMLWFNKSKIKEVRKTNTISIHLMLWFNFNVKLTNM